MNREGGFTMVEILIVLGIVMIVTVIAMAGSVPQSKKARTEEFVSSVTSFIFQTQQNAYGGKDATKQGVSFSASHIDLFTGQNYSEAISTDRISLPSGMTISTINFESQSYITFDTGSFRPSNAGSVVITDGTHSYTVYVTTEGLIYYQ